MTILDTINTKYSKIIFVEIEKYLKSPITNYCLPASDSEIIQNTKGELRQLERLTARLCLKKSVKNYQGVNYHENGRPYLIGEHQQLSISHSRDILCVLLSDSEFIGIDIQFPSEKIRRVAHRVFNEGELNWANDDLKKLTQLWCVKEAVFKSCRIKGLDFRKEILVDTKTFIVSVQKGNYTQSFSVEVIDFKGYCTAYIL